MHVALRPEQVLGRVGVQLGDAPRVAQDGHLTLEPVERRGPAVVGQRTPDDRADERHGGDEKDHEDGGDADEG
ncbi:hypothetical protein GCM10010972_31980 [Cellulomonas carbonis]|nr:hypothetical protein GCM10010972_31980 [Cellulomonas carbonis]